MSHRTRRALLTAVAGATSLLAGCSLLAGRTDLNQVEIDNNSGATIEVQVEVTNESGETLFEETFSVAAGGQDEGADPFGGVPARVSVSVDGAEALTAEWPEDRVELRAGQDPRVVGDGCGQGDLEPPSGVFVEVESPTWVLLRPTCETPQPSS
jgi:hypothetical protein